MLSLIGSVFRLGCIWRSVIYVLSSLNGVLGTGLWWTLYGVGVWFQGIFWRLYELYRGTIALYQIFITFCFIHAVKRRTVSTVSTDDSVQFFFHKARVQARIKGTLYRLYLFRTKRSITIAYTLIWKLPPPGIRGPPSLISKSHHNDPHFQPRSLVHDPCRNIPIPVPHRPILDPRTRQSVRYMCLLEEGSILPVCRTLLLRHER